MTKQSDQDEAETAGQRADPVATRNADLAHAGGLFTGEVEPGGAGFGSGPTPKGTAKPSGTRAKSDAPIASDVAPMVHTAMDDDLHAVEEQSHRTTRPGADG